MSIRKIEIPISGKPFKNNAPYCVGTGRMGLALQKEYIDHLKIVQEAIHFRYIRGHGLFCDAGNSLSIAESRQSRCVAGG